MSLPKSVRDQAKKAEDLHKEVYGKEGEDKGTPSKVEDEPEKAPVKAEPAKEPAPEPLLVQPVIPVQGAEDFEQKYSVIPGK